MIKVIELFAGVGGFRVGLNNIKFKNKKIIEKKDFKFVFFNQWEPSFSSQNAYVCYSKRFNDKLNDLNNLDITKIDKNLIPNHDLLVGGFPCQDYSVARTISNEKGIDGKKGILWWEIYKILKAKNSNFVLLENVDRLLISPSNQRGRNFAIILKCFEELNYYVEWKVIKASDYGMPQKRKRIFIFACKKTTKFFDFVIKKNLENDSDAFKLFENKNNFFAKEFDFKIIHKHPFYELSLSLDEISEFKSCTFFDSGIMLNNKVFTIKTKSIFKGKKIVLKDIILPESQIDKKFFINDENKLKKFEFLKDKKKIEREKNGHKYFYTEGKMSFSDNINLPGRTMLTSEGSLNRSTHIIECSNGKYRLLTPTECERLNMFPDDWTKIEGMSDKSRNFLMGNALVCGIIKKIAKPLKKAINMEKK